MILDLMVSAVMLLGAVFTLLAALGVVRFPDAFTRLHAAAKAGVLGAGLIVVATAISMSGADAALRAAVTLTFLLLTAPIAGHAIGRAAYLSRDVELSPETVADEWKQRLDGLRAPVGSSPRGLAASGGSPQAVVRGPGSTPAAGTSFDTSDDERMSA